MNRFLAATLLSVLCTTVTADDKADRKALAGTWLVEKAEIDGADMTKVFPAATLMLEAEKYTFILDKAVPDKADKGTIALDSTKTPKAMDVAGTEGPNKGKTYPCIYELKDDTFTICYGMDFKTRPTELTTKKDSQRMLVVYKRKKG